MPDRDIYSFYFTTTSDGDVHYVLDNLRGTRRTFVTYESVPKFHSIPHDFALNRRGGAGEEEEASRM